MLLNIFKKHFYQFLTTFDKFFIHFFEQVSKCKHVMHFAKIKPNPLTPFYNFIIIAPLNHLIQLWENETLCNSEMPYSYRERSSGSLQMTWTFHHHENVKTLSFCFCLSIVVFPSGFYFVLRHQMKNNDFSCVNQKFFLLALASESGEKHWPPLGHKPKKKVKRSMIA